MFFLNRVHTYTSETDNTVTVNCSNQVSFDTDTLVVKSRYPITNLRFDKTGALSTATDFQIKWFVDQGTVLHTDWNLTFDGYPSVAVLSWDQATKTGLSNVCTRRDTSPTCRSENGQNLICVQEVQSARF